MISEFAIIPYLSSVFGIDSITIISSSNATLMLVMLSMLLILPISFIPIHKNDKRRIAPIYMAGENSGDNESFNGSIGVKREVELHNWYLKEYFGNKRITLLSNIVALTILCVGILLLILGVAK